MKKDMFDLLEENLHINYKSSVVLLVKNKRNKRSGKNPLYLSGINSKGDLYFKKGIENAYLIHPYDYFFTLIKVSVNINNIKCRLVIMDRSEYDYLKNNKPVRKKKWWERFKVWFFRKVKKE